MSPKTSLRSGERLKEAYEMTRLFSISWALLVISLAAVAPARPDGCTAWIKTAYYTSAAHTTLVGECNITCAQYDSGNEYPQPGGGGVCTGEATSFPVEVYSTCPCPQ
ncbi:MAG TPA: hypothetical protein VMW75_27805 [Thermoanaerobaculia bacterium]|nr:hypothetical protein [Thermoanaerobaculia bacterium]